MLLRFRCRLFFLSPFAHDNNSIRREKRGDSANKLEYGWRMFFFSAKADVEHKYNVAIVSFRRACEHKYPAVNSATLTNSTPKFNLSTDQIRDVSPVLVETTPKNGQHIRRIMR